MAYNLSINKNKLSGSEMSFTQNGFTVKDGETFLLDDKNLQSNNVTLKATPKLLTDINHMMKRFKKGRYKNHLVEIKQSFTGK
jgi:hypothetical protein